MTSIQLEYLRDKFNQYCRSFYSPSAEDQKNILLKQEHTSKVCENMAMISGDVFSDGRLRTVAQAVALCHDIGRFPQYKTYRTFKDSESVNHAALGAAVLLQEDFLAEVEAKDRDIIVSAVRFHNVFSIPPNISPEVLPFLKLVRDADKLDIWRVFIEYFEAPPAERASAAGLGFADAPECTREVVDQILLGRMVQLSTVRTLHDFKLLQLSWVFDLNYPSSFRLVAERGYISQLAQTLPVSAGVDAAVSFLNEFLQRCLKRGV